MNALHDGRTPIVDESKCSFQSPLAIFIDEVFMRHWEQCVPFTTNPVFLDHQAEIFATFVVLDSFCQLHLELMR
jgi:hypothetical protein